MTKKEISYIKFNFPTKPFSVLGLSKRWSI